ncbi:MAG: hypothetical protein WCS94_15015 [Verrucomicrobiota bacterium]
MKALEQRSFLQAPATMAAVRSRVTAGALFLLALALPGRVSAVLNIYPAPGDLSTIANLKQSGDFTVKVNGQDCFVYESPKYFKHPKGWGNRPQDTVSFTSFAFSGEPVTVAVTCNDTIKTCTIRPKSARIPYTQNGHTITFTLKSPQKLSVEVNDQKRPLLIVAEAPDLPDKTATYYFGPGVHKVGTKKEIKDGESVYIAAGAVVEGTFLCTGHNNKFRGRGIITSGYIPWDKWKTDSSVCMFTYPKFKSVTNNEFEGLFLLNSPGWYNRGQLVGSTVKNIKFIAWNGNTDGLHLGGNSLMEDCLFFQNDDCLIGSFGNNNTWRNCVIWKGNYGRPIVSLISSTAKNYLWENIDIIGMNGREPTVLLNNFRNQNTALIDGYVIRNVRVESPRTCRLIEISAKNLTVKHVLFENVSTDTTIEEEGLIAASHGGVVDGIEFCNLRLAGKPITSLKDAKISTSGSVTNCSLTVTASKSGTR